MADKIYGNDPTGAQRVIDELTVIVGGLASQLKVAQSVSGLVEEDGFYNFGIYINDVDSGVITSANIDITGIVVSLKKSTGGVDFSDAGITQPTFVKADGKVSVSYRFLAAEWTNGDGYSLDVSGIEAAIGTDTAYVPPVNWCSSIVESANVETKIDTIDTVVDGIQTDLDNGTDGLGALKTLIDNVQTDTTAIITDIADAVPEPPTAKSLQDILHKDTSYTYDKATDSLEAISDNIATGSLEIEADAGTTATNIIDAVSLTQATNDWFKGATVVSMNGQNAGQARPIVNFTAATDSIDVYPAFLNTPDAGDDFLIVSSYKSNILSQQPDVAINTNANIAAVDILDLNTAGLTYMVNNLIIKSADPGANTVTLTLYELVNDASVAVDTFDITTANYTNYFSLYDMFSRHHLSGDDIQITLTCDADGNHVVTGQYQYAECYTG